MQQSFILCGINGADDDMFSHVPQVVDGDLYGCDEDDSDDDGTLMTIETLMMMMMMMAMKVRSILIPLTSFMFFFVLCTWQMYIWLFSF